MRLWSTPESTRVGEPSLLAIVETVAAMGASVWIGLHFGTWVHVAAGAGLAPFLLLRTDASCESGVRQLSRYIEWATAEKFGFLGSVLYLILPVIAAGIRFWATAMHFAAHPIETLMGFPGNWWRTAVAADSATSPEWIPLPVGASLESLDAVDPAIRVIAPIYRFAPRGIRVIIRAAVGNARAATGASRIFGTVLITLLVSSTIVLATVSALAYRWSIKSTALIWFPLLWALKPAKPADRDWKKHLKIESDLKKPQFVAVWSGICLALITLKYVLWAARVEIAENAEAWREVLGGWGPRVADSPLAEGIIAFVRPGAIPLWQVAVFFNSLLGLFVWWKIRDWLAHFRHGVPPADQSISRTLAVTFFFRHFLTSYVIICDGYIAIQMARKLPLPTIGSQLFPWV